MRKLFIGLFAIIMAVSASAITQSYAPKPDDPSLHWFSPTGVYLGFYPRSVQQSMCSGTLITCANGYTSLDGEGQPIGNPEVIKKNS